MRVAVKYRKNMLNNFKWSNVSLFVMKYSMQIVIYSKGWLGFVNMETVLFSIRNRKFWLGFYRINYGAEEEQLCNYLIWASCKRERGGEVVEFEREMYSLFTHVTRYIIDITCIHTTECAYMVNSVTNRYCM